MLEREGVAARPLQVGAQLEQVGAIGLERVAREPPLELQIGEEVEHEVLERLGAYGDGHAR